VHADEVREMVDHEQSASAELVIVCGSASGQRISETPGVVDLAHEVIGFGPGADEAGSAAVAHAVRGQFAHGENDVVDPVDIQASVVRVPGGRPPGVTPPGGGL
jgi:hypothetical protein